MKTYKISKDEIKDLPILATGYKACKFDLGTQQNFAYGKIGEDIIGTVWKVDGDIEACQWGLHFSKDPANVFNFYAPLGYNRYFKVNAYEKSIDNNDGIKSVAQVIEFVEEYDIMQFIELIKGFNRVVSDSNAVIDSNAVSYSNAVSGSNAVRGSNAVSDSTAVRNCKGVYNSIFCVDKNGISNYLFNKKSTEKRIQEIKVNLNCFNWEPQFANWYDIKGNKEWCAFCFPQLEYVDNKTAWAKMPIKMLEYIKSLPEFNEEIFNKIIGD